MVLYCKEDDPIPPRTALGGYAHANKKAPPATAASTDLYEQTFGKPPELTSVLGSKAAVKSLYMKRGQTF